MGEGWAVPFTASQSSKAGIGSWYIPVSEESSEGCRRPVWQMVWAKSWGLTGDVSDVLAYGQFPTMGRGCARMICCGMTGSLCGSTSRVAYMRCAWNAASSCHSTVSQNLPLVGVFVLEAWRDDKQK